MNNGFSPSRRAWNRVMTILVWASAVLVMILVAGIIGMVLVLLVNLAARLAKTKLKQKQ